MSAADLQNLKDQVRDFWNEQSCDTQVANAPKFSREYFEEIEAFRYFDQPFIHSFAQFTRYRDKKVLEVGFGAGTDFIQWLRAGAIASGIDLTPEALKNLSRRVEVYNLPKPDEIQVGDAENLPFTTDRFDLGYSFGVLHHSPDTQRAIAELIRVVCPGGEIKIMLYNRHSVWTLNRWVKFALLKGRPWKSLKWVMWHHNESLGTKAFTRGELVKMLSAFPLERIHIHTELTAGDYLSASALPPLNFLYRSAIRLAGYQYGWRPSHYAARVNAEQEDKRKERDRGEPEQGERVLFTGNRLGFFHCITARKAR